MARLQVPTVLRWGDLDAYGHVNNAEMLHLLEEARIQAFWSAGEESGDHGATAILDSSPGTQTWSLIARQEVEYLAPIAYTRQPLDIQLWIGHMGGASLEIFYEVFSPVGVEPRVLHTRAASTLVLVDATTQRPRRINDAERAAWSPFVDEPLQFRRR
ncbi:acyl-CoA thioester hydrolase [Frondihabitans sp. PhB188]|uniref:acyl-CoA thioesterase n=1 Tax=Frondihabitans sp. PhB188 TaxID=2485200 RepID=UPI000F4738A5|nr:thioesterase family protein [Frondihabitans sp. PhB188]ROQ38331.1 acyl-CoA thioester hydrolase [Frondihabitans sp. PhB188]